MRSFFADLTIFLIEYFWIFIVLFFLLQFIVARIRNSAKDAKSKKNIDSDKSNIKEDAILLVDQMNEKEFAKFFAELLKRDSYEIIKTIKDERCQETVILAETRGIKHAFLCKKCHPSEILGEETIQEAINIRRCCDCSTAAVVTNGFFSVATIRASMGKEILLLDRLSLRQKIYIDSFKKND